MPERCASCVHFAPSKWSERNDRMWPLRRWDSQCQLPRPTPTATAPPGATMGARWPAARDTDWCAFHELARQEASA